MNDIFRNVIGLCFLICPFSILAYQSHEIKAGINFAYVEQGSYFSSDLYSGFGFSYEYLAPKKFYFQNSYDFLEGSSKISSIDGLQGSVRFDSAQDRTLFGWNFFTEEWGVIPILGLVSYYEHGSSNILYSRRESVLELDTNFAGVEFGFTSYYAMGEYFFSSKFTMVSVDRGTMDFISDAIDLKPTNYFDIGLMINYIHRENWGFFADLDYQIRTLKLDKIIDRLSINQKFSTLRCQFGVYRWI